MCSKALKILNLIPLKTESLVLGSMVLKHSIVSINEIMPSMENKTPENHEKNDFKKYLLNVEKNDTVHFLISPIYI